MGGGGVDMSGCNCSECRSKNPITVIPSYMFSYFKVQAIKVLLYPSYVHVNHNLTK